VTKHLRIAAILFLVGIFFSNALLQTATILFFPFTVYLIIRRIKKEEPSLIEVLIVLLFFCSLISVYISIEPSIAVKNIVYHSILLTLIPIAHLVKTDDKISIDLIGKIISILGLITAALGIFHFMNGAERSYGFYGGYYTLASIMVFSIPITVASSIYSQKKWKYFILISILTQACSLWLTFTRSALLGLFIAALVTIIFLFTNANITRAVKGKITLASVFVIITIITLLLTSSDSRLNPLLFLSNPDLSSGRNEVYNDAAKLISTDLKYEWKNILLGHGLESRIILFPKSDYTSWESDYIESFISQGLIGLILTIFIYFQFFRGLLHAFSKVKNTDYSRFALGLISSGISIWVISFFSSQLIGKTSSAHFVILYSLGILLTKKTQSETNP